MDKFKSYTQQQVAFAIADCHATLSLWRRHGVIFNHSKTAVDRFVDGYAADHPYVKKLWAEIDALRDRDAVLRKNK